MMEIEGAELDGMVGTGSIVEVDACREVADAGVIGHVEGHLLGAFAVVGIGLDTQIEVVAILGIGAGDVHEELGVDDIVPTGRADDISPAVAELHPGLLDGGGVEDALAGLHTGIDFVVAHIIGEVEAAVVAELMGYFGVDVVEIVACVGGEAGSQGGDAEEGLEERVGIGASA